MKTVGSMLKEARFAKGYTLEEVESATKIRIKFLSAIEADDFSVLPTVTYAKGFVKNYSEYLGLDSHTILAFFRRQTLETPKSSLLPKGMAEPLNSPFFRLTPGRFLALVLTFLVVMFLLYLGIQYRTIRQPPKLTVDSPKQQEITHDRRIEVLGRTDPDATVTINGTSVLVRSDGRFFDQITLESGVNTVTVVAISRFGRTTTVTREVGLRSP